MNSEIREIVNYVKTNQSSYKTTEQLIDQYFKQFVWSIEKEEWEKLTVYEREAFAEIIENALSI